MKRVLLASATPGSSAALPVFHPTRHGSILLRPGVKLDEQTLSRLASLGIREVWLEADGLDDVGRHVSVKMIDTRAELTEQLAAEFARLSRDAKAGPRVDPLKAIIEQLVEQITAAPDTARWIHEPDLPDQPMLRNAIFCGIVSMLVGRNLESYLVRQRPKLAPSHASDVRGLTLAGLLHDVGLLRVEPHVLQVWRDTGEETDVRWRQHVRHGYEMLRDRVEPATAAAVLNHHQRYDGLGFPARLGNRADAAGIAGTSVHVFSRIIAAADTFDRLRHPIGVEEPVPTVRVLSEMLEGETARTLDPVVAAAMARVVPPFPPGARVMLSDGRNATVAGINDAEPCRPPVLIDGTAISKNEETGSSAAKLLELDEQTKLRITHVDGVSIERDLFRLARYGEQEAEEPVAAAPA